MNLRLWGLFLAGNRVTHPHRHMLELGHRDLARMPCDSHHELNAPLKLINLSYWFVSPIPPEDSPWQVNPRKHASQWGSVWGALLFSLIQHLGTISEEHRLPTSVLGMMSEIVFYV